MTKKELYKEFKNVTHFNDTGLNVSISRFTKLEVDGKQLANHFEGILIKIGGLPPLTYFHKEATND